LEKNKISLTQTIEEIKFQIEKIKNKLYSSPLPHKNRLLIVEDNDASVIQLKFVLESAGYIADIAKSGKNALLYLQKIIPDGIILDLMMPEMDGFQLLELINELREIQNIPVLILTAKNLTAEDLKLLSDRNIQQLIQKGDINRDELLFNIGIMLKSAQKKELNNNQNYYIDSIKVIENNESINPQLKKILMIEDNPDNIATLLAILKNRYIVIYSTEGTDGYDLACTENPDLILLDVMLPGISGIEILKRIKQNDETSKIPVIAVTAQAMKGDKEKLLLSGFDDYLSKPIDPLILIEKINDLI
jgi:CheY-like chemotaxis protein